MAPLTNICAQFEQVGQAFATPYYNVFDPDRGHLGSLYKDDVSMLNFEHSAERPGQFKGTAAILQNLQSLPFQKVQHQIVTIDCQPTPGGGVRVMICVNLLIDAERMHTRFRQVFQMLPSGS